jgi:hypothetical protein
MTALLRSPNRRDMNAYAILACALCLGLCTQARADGLADLKAALARVGPTAAVSGALAVEVHRQQGDADDIAREDGRLSVFVEEGPAGLQLRYPPELMARAAAERAERDRNPEAKTPVLIALQALRVEEVRDMVTSTDMLTRLLDRATYRGERAATQDGAAVRVLEFELALGNLSRNFRKYVRKHQGSMELTIAADGTPVALRVREQVDARAFLIITFQTVAELDCVFALKLNRLVTTERKAKRRAEGAGENFEEDVLMTLDLNRPG